MKFQPNQPQFWNRRYANRTTLALRGQVVVCLETCLDDILGKAETCLTADMAKLANELVDSYEDKGVHWTGIMLASDLANKSPAFFQMALETV